jgi:membrane protein DedA with SNARE-associated domain
MLSHELIARYGALIVFLNVFASSLGLPVPAAPTLVMVGAGMSLAAGDVASTLAQLGTTVGAAAIGGVLGDLVWFQGGKRYGERALHGVFALLMLRPTCVRYMERFFTRWGVRVLVVSRFVPGLALVSVPLCGAMAVRLRAFMLHDCAGIGLWASAAVAAGAMFAPQIDRTAALATRFGWHALAAAAFALALYVPYRHFRRAIGESGPERIGAGADAADEPAFAGAAPRTSGAPEAGAAYAPAYRRTTTRAPCGAWSALAHAARPAAAFHALPTGRRRRWRRA